MNTSSMALETPARLPSQRKIVLDFLLDKHSHECPGCGCVWEHLGDSGGIEWAHHCPNCGAEQYTRYAGGKPVDFFFGV